LNSKLHIAQRITGIQSDEDFDAVAKEWFEKQVSECAPYQEFTSHLRARAVHFEHPFLPVELFKNHRVSTSKQAKATFYSSGTQKSGRSAHHVYDLDLYNTLSVHHFESLYGPLSDFVVLALLPSYLENGDSSLVYMVDQFIQRAKPGSEFVLNKPEVLTQILNEKATEKILLIGVSYALLDYADMHRTNHSQLIVMETGGMKGRREELTRQELHQRIRKGFPQAEIHSEYGMTELLSQAYSKDGTWFIPPKWMRVEAIDISDPLHVLPRGKRGLLAFTDLGNRYSCSFIQTKDIGYVSPEGSFVVEGRLDTSDLRGCNLLYT